jgi:predicted glutamine amidotransferase
MIPRLEDLSIGMRIVVLIAISLIVLFVLFILGMFSVEGGRSEAQGQEQIEIYAGVPIDRKFLELDKKALDDAYNKHLLLLFDVWLKSGDVDGARRFSNGMRIARGAYAAASREITKRELLSEERERDRDRDRRK